MKTYTWNFQKEAERWDNGAHDSIEACIEEANDCAVEDGEQHNDTVYIGEVLPFASAVDAVDVLDMLKEQACDFAGEYGDDWEAYDPKKRDELDELSAALTATVCAWMEKYGYTPCFYVVENVKAHRMGVEGRVR